MLQAYARENYMGNTKFYVDDGYTGTNFNRPGFQELLDDIEMGYVSTIIVKDMSHFGREYLQVGYYTENYFPDHNIRIIAINDNVDCVDGATDMDDFIPIKNIMNELYAKDISRKVRSAHNTRGRAGEPLSQPPYGYVKDPQDKKCWIIDPEAASVVREIFKLYLDGNGEDTIARIMQEEQHLNCTAYWASKGINRGGKKSQPNPYKWKSSTIHGILTRQEYCGDVLNFKTRSKSFKNHRRIDNPKEDWMVFEDRHEAIILRDTYQKVQKRLKSTHQRAPKEINGPKSIFCDILRCADCGSKLWYHINTQNRDIHYFSCSNYVKDYRGTCLTRHYIRADAVEAVVEMELRRLAEYLIADENRFAEILARRSIKQVESEKKTVQSELRKSEMRIEIIPKLLKTLYEDKLSGKTSEDNYCVLSQEYSDEREQLEKKILKLRRILYGNTLADVGGVVRTALRGINVQIPDEFVVDDKSLGFVFARPLRFVHINVVNQLVQHLFGQRPHFHELAYRTDELFPLVFLFAHFGQYISCEPTDSLKELFSEGYNADDDSFKKEETEQV